MDRVTRAAALAALLLVWEEVARENIVERICAGW